MNAPINFIPSKQNVADSQRIRLVHLQLLPLLSGVQKVTLDEFAGLDQAQYDRILVCKTNGPLVKAVGELGVKCEYIEDLERSISPRADLRALIALVKCFRRLTPDVVHTHSSKTGVLGRIAAKIAGVPNVIHTVHGFAFPFAKSRLTRYFYFIAELFGSFCSDTVIVLNDTDYKYARNSLRISERKLLMIPNGVDMDAFGKARGDERDRYRKEVLGVDAPDTLCVAMIGRLWEQKNPLCLVEAAQKVLLRHGSNVRFFFVGDGELKKQVEERIAGYGIGDKVEVLGWRSDVPTLLSCVDIFVLPSLWEGMPLAILEAMASELPVVVSDIPGNNDLVEDNVDGLLFPAKDADGLAAQVSRLAADPKLRARLASAARIKVANKYSLARRLAEVNELYENGVVMDDDLSEQAGLSY